LRFNKTKKRQHLQENYHKASLQQLTEAELLEFLHYLTNWQPEEFCFSDTDDPVPF
jgi:hypothetical protein